MFFLIISLIFVYAVFVGVAFQMVPYDQKGYNQTEERMIKSIFWPVTLPFFIGAAFAQKYFVKVKSE